jgi:hypothetical protein
VHGPATARGSWSASHLREEDVAFSSAERNRHLGIRPVSLINTQQRNWRTPPWVAGSLAFAFHRPGAMALSVRPDMLGVSRELPRRSPDTLRVCKPAH